MSNGELVVVLFATLVILAVVYLLISGSRKDEQELEMDRRLKANYHKQMARQSARMARMGDDESRIMEFVETGELPPLKSKPGRPLGSKNKKGVKNVTSSNGTVH